MELILRNKNIIKNYNLEYKEKRYLNDELVEEIDKKLKIAIEYMGRNITFKFLGDIKGNDTNEYEKILELAEQSFDNIKFTTDSTGKIDKLRNLDEISNKWNNIKRYYFSDVKDKYIKDFVFEISKIISNEKKVTEMIKEYNIIPYIFTGLYNQQYSESYPIRVNMSLSNIFSSMPIPVILEIYGKEYSGADKMLSFIGKEASNFDRFTYMNTFEKKYPELQYADREKFDFSMKGLYLYDASDNLLTHFDMAITTNIRKQFKGEITYTLKEHK